MLHVHVQLLGTHFIILNSLGNIAQSVPFSSRQYFMSGDHFKILRHKKVTLKKVELKALSLH